MIEVETDLELVRLLLALGDAQPAYFTHPTPGALHDLESCRVIARALGTPLMPWMELVLRVATERRLDDSRQFRYPIVVLTVPRQSGKTTTVRIKLVQRAIANNGRRAFYTAQTGKDATARWKDMVKAVEGSALHSFAQVRLAAGSQSLTFPNGSTIAPFAPTARSLHGYTPHDVDLDEVFDYSEEQGNDVMGAVGPAQVTLPDRQLWLLSTMGHAGSTFWHGWIEVGRAATLDPDTQIAYFEWSLPEDHDPENPEHWTFHPALGHTITLERLVELRSQHTFGEWMRAFMNRRTSSRDAVIDPALMLSRATAITPPASTSLVGIGYEVALDRSRSSIRAAWLDTTSGKLASRTLVAGPGADWVPAKIAELRELMHPRGIGADQGGAATRDVTDTIKRDYPALGEEIELLGPRDFATACDAWKAGIIDGTAAHDGEPGLLAAVDAAAIRPFTQGWAWDRTKSTGQIADLVADTVARRIALHAPAPMPQPYFRESK
ncbi:MAG TPA: terminase family protein [Galbitalea sp.]